MLQDRVVKLIVVTGLTGILFFKLAPSGIEPSRTALFAAAFLLACCWIITNAMVRLHAHLRSKWAHHPASLRMAKAVFCCLAFSLAGVAAIYSSIDNFFMLHEVKANEMKKVVAVAGLFLLPSVLYYEVLFLTKERELDDRVLQQLNTELTEAELNFLKNELDPHFVYNSLMPLYYLIKNNSNKAEQFTFRLMQVYQHFLQNRKKDLIPFEEEYCFLENYIYLLRIRYNNSLSLKLEKGVADNRLMIVPLTLQLLIENAIKHTEFDADNPLEIHVSYSDGYLAVWNRLTLASQPQQTTRVGLKNLRMRYKYLLNRSIKVYTDNNQFVVKIPLIRNQNQHDVRRYHRG